MTLHNAFNFKTNVCAEAAHAMSQQATGNYSLIKAFHDVDERQRIAMRQAFDEIAQVSATAKQRVSAIASRFGVSERQVWLAVKNDRSLGAVLNERCWRHGLTVSLGNGLNVSKEQVKHRLRYLGLRLKRRIWGNDHREQRKIEFVVFKHWLIPFCGHWHAVMAVEGRHNWSDQMIADAINEIERDRKTERGYEKTIHVDFNWRDGNQFHSYIGREAKYDNDSYFLMRI